MSLLKPSTIATIKATAPVLAIHGYAITSAMYKRMLPSNPKVSELFNPTHQIVLPGDKLARQPHALAESVLAYANNIDNLAALGTAVERIAQKHVSLHILPEHYPVVGTNLLAAIKDVLGDAATPDILDAWADGYQLLADIFIARERELRETKAAQPGGWQGWRDFIVAKKVVESADATSFHLTPQDGQPILGFLPGQYIGIRVETPTLTTQRNYSLSNGPGASEYRITVKKEGPIATGCPVGVVSTHLHDHVHEGDVVKMSVPSGDFFLAIDHDKPIVLLSGGIGITPMASMAEFLATKAELANDVVMINCSRCPNTATLGERFKKLAGERNNFTVKTVYGSSDGGDAKGRLTTQLLQSFVGGDATITDAHYYFCGPPGFMVNVRTILEGLSVPAEQIHFEFFGPHDSHGTA